MQKISVFALLIIYLIYINKINASIGDNSPVYGECMSKCWFRNCTTRSGSVKYANKTRFDLNQPYYLKLLGWDCTSECKYMCMWKTVELYIQVHNYVPQFYGKWPFVRIWGVQEPVSAFASILNFASNVYMIRVMHRNIYTRTPFKTLWYLFSLISLNTWICSTIFHTRDTPLTEKMDYFSAFGFVLFQFNCFFVRVLKLEINNSLPKLFLMYLINFVSLLYFIYHVYYLGFVKFDYGFNMKVNIGIGALNSICWIYWSMNRYFNLNLNYVWRCGFSVLLFDLLMILEVFDFSPFLWSIDSHGLWHLTTAVIPIFWYKFIIDDCRHLDLKGGFEKIK